MSSYALIESIGNPARARFAHQLWQMGKMFEGYSPMLSEHGQQAAHDTVAAQHALTQRCYEGSEIRRGEILVGDVSAAREDFEVDNFMAWFDLSRYQLKAAHSNNGAIVRGCSEPCHICYDGNGNYWGRSDPAPVVIGKMKRGLQLRNKLQLNFVYQGDPFEWMDPFLEAHLGWLFGYASKLDPNFESTFFYTKGWGLHTWRAQQAAEMLSSMPSEFIDTSWNASREGPRVEITISFHLALSNPDILRAVLEVGGGRIPQGFVEQVAQRYADVFRTLGDKIYEVRINHDIAAALIGVVADEGRRSEIADAFTKATKQAFTLACQLAGLPDDSRLDRYNYQHLIEPKGRGRDFARRLWQVWEGNPAGMVPDRSIINGFRDHPAIDVEIGYPEVLVSCGGRVQVRDPDDFKNLLVNTNLDTLWPNSEGES